MAWGYGCALSPTPNAFSTRSMKSTPPNVLRNVSISRTPFWSYGLGPSVGKAAANWEKSSIFPFRGDELGDLCGVECLENFEALPSLDQMHKAEAMRSRLMQPSVTGIKISAYEWFVKNPCSYRGEVTGTRAALS